MARVKIDATVTITLSLPEAIALRDVSGGVTLSGLHTLVPEVTEEQIRTFQGLYGPLSDGIGLGQ